LRVPSAEHHVALPQLYGAPAYARPSKPVALLERPFDPDDLPIELERTPEDQELVAWIAQRPFAPTPGAPGDRDDHDADGGLPGRPFWLHLPTSRIFHGE
jgi:hypothetical protein